MKDKDYSQIVELAYMGGGFIPANDKANELTEQLSKGEVISFIEVTQRDLKFHKCYMSLLGYIWEYLPAKFKKSVPKHNFYKWLKHLKCQYSVLFEFKDGTKLVEYDSIAFGNMSQERFKNYVREQLPFIYTHVIGAFFEGEMYDNIISTIEKDYEKFFDKLN